MFTFGSLFSGVGGFDLGFECVGMTCLWQVEIDKKCQASLERHWPNVRRYRDVKKVGRELGAVDLICGGFPCQDLSVAGRRGGLAGERSGLWFEYRRVIEELHPRWVVIENVPGLLSSWGPTEPPPFEIPTRDFDTEEEAQRWADSIQGEWEVEEKNDLETILSSLEELSYGWAFAVLDSQYFGVPQRRRRVFIVGYSGDVGGLEQQESREKSRGFRGLPTQVLFESESGSGNSPSSREAGQRVAASVKAGTPSRRNGGSWPVAEESVVAIDVRNLREQRNGISGTLQAKKAGGYSLNYINPIVFGGNNTQGPIDVATACNAHGSGRYDFESETFIAFPGMAQSGAGWAPPSMPIDENRTGPLDTKRAQCVAYGVSENQRAELRLTPYSRQITSGGGKPGQGYSAALTQYGVRRLTPTECERLQAFPDGWTNEQADSPRYRQMGNAVTVSVIEWIGKRIMEIEGRDD